MNAPSDPAPREGAAGPTGLSAPEAALVVGIVGGVMLANLNRW